MPITQAASPVAPIASATVSPRRHTPRRHTPRRHRPRRHTPRRGQTLLELLCVLSLLAIVAGTVLTSGGALRDALAVRAATREAAATLASARELAAAHGVRTAVRIDAAAGVLLIHTGPDTLTHVPIGERHAVTLAATRDSLAFQPDGLAFGVANLRLIISRGASQDTLTMSRLGRVRW